MSSKTIGGVSETMLQTLYARAKESKRPGHRIYDAKAVEIAGQMDYDFSAAQKDAVMSAGVIARTILLDGMVQDFVKENPDACVVNIACGMDTRFWRVDNGKILWYNIDLPAAMKVRQEYILEDPRVTDISLSAMDPAWAKQIPETDRPVLVIAEGLSMYLQESDVERIFSIIGERFVHATVFMEILNPKFVGKDIEKSISKSGAVFTFGAKSGKELSRLAPDFTWTGDRSLAEGMEVLYPIFKVIGKIGFVRNISNKIAVLKK